MSLREFSQIMSMIFTVLLALLGAYEYTSGDKIVGAMFLAVSCLAFVLDDISEVVRKENG